MSSLNNDGVTFIEASRGLILLDALETINGARQDTYGNPEDSFYLIAQLWSAYLRDKLKLPIHKHDVAMLMTLFKTARIKKGVDHIDSYVDACGYLAIAAGMVGADEEPRVDGSDDEDNEDKA